MTKPRHKPAAQRRERDKRIPITPAEARELNAAAARAGLAFATWARMELLRIARAT